MTNFAKAIEQMIDDVYNVSITENGAVGYRTTNQPLLDMNFKIASYRNKSVAEIREDFMHAYAVDPVLTMQWLFYARDCREGVGERRLFREMLKVLGSNKPIDVIKVIPFIPEYGRYDDLWELLEGVNPAVTREVLAFVKKQLTEDIANVMKDKPISLLGKWLPSANASSPITKRRAAIIRKYIGFSEKKYRKALTALRKHSKVLEVQMSAREWDKIDYEAVPSKANLIYNSAFLRNDEIRRREFLAAANSGERKINASVLFPHEIVSKYRNCYRLDANLEALWKALPNTVNGNENTIVVADGSGSMCTTVDRHSNTTALDVANALAIYFAERSSGQFKDKYITFSERPQLVDLSAGKSLSDKLTIARRHNEVANTNIEAVFDLILNTAITNKMSQEDLPKNILIISDMEFDCCACCGTPVKAGYWGGYRCTGTPDAKLFEVIANKYAAAGYKMPRLVFWNVNSRTGTIPVKENDLGVALVSGFSANLAKMVMSNKTDPYECLLETLNSPRYLPIREALLG